MTHNPAPFVRWLEERDRAPLTVEAYTRYVTDFAAWFQTATGHALDPARVTPLDVKAYRRYLVKERRLKPNTVNGYLAGVRAFARWGQETGRAEHDPTREIQTVKIEESAPRWLERTEQWALIRAAREAVQLGDLRAGGDLSHPGAIWPRRDQALVVLLLNAGLRREEAAGLHVDDLQLHERSGKVQVLGKGRKARQVPLNSDVRKALQEWLAVRPESTSARLFLSQKGGALSKRALGACVTRLAERAGLKEVTPHTLRHSFAKNLVDEGVGLEQVAKLLGHANLETTRLYTTPSEADLQAATERVAWGA